MLACMRRFERLWLGGRDSSTFAKATADKNPDNVQSHPGFLPTSHQSLTTSPAGARYAASIPELRYVACSELPFQRW